MCETLVELDQALTRYAAQFEAGTLSGEQASKVVRLAAGIEKVAVAIKAVAAARVAQTGTWKASGARSAAADLARTAGTSISAAADTLETARRMEALPVVAAAARRGQLSGAQASAIAAAAEADPRRSGAPGGAGRDVFAGRAA